MNLKGLSKFSWALLLMVLTCTGLYAQERKVTGRVVDQQDKQPIPGVNVSIKGKPSNVSTNGDGVFTIQVDSDADALVFSYIGYIRQTVTVGKQATINISLASDNKDLDEVVVVGYGTQKRTHLTGSVVDIKAAEVEDLPSSNIGAALAGRILGVGVSGGISRPGSTARLTIRNPNTIFSKDGGSTDPLYVIDDVMQINPQNGQPDATLFNNLDPSEIESLSFLKDASAAIYGTRAGNGVVLVKTKRGKVGPPKISYSGSYALNDEAYRTKVLNAYEFGMYYNIMNGPNGAAASPGVDNFFTQDELDHFKNIDYDWLDGAWKPSYNMKHTLSVSGGTDRATYFGDVAYYKQNGNLASLDFNRWNFRSGADVKVATNLKVGLQVSGNNSDLVKTFNKIGNELDDNDYRNLILAPRYIPMYVNGYPVKLPGTTNDFSTYHFYEIERLGNLANTRSKTFTVNVNAEYQIPFVKGLTARASYGRNMGSSLGSQIGTKFNLYEFERTGTNKHIYEGAPLKATNPIVVASNGNRLYYSNTTQSSTQSNFILTYNKTFGKHSVSGLATVEKSEQDYENQVVQRADPSLQTNGQLNTATGPVEGSTARSEGGSLSYVGRANYSYADKYLAEFLFRSDASTKFAPGNYWGKFYSGSIGWVISEEDFFKVPAIDFLKIRYSAGLLGNDQTKAWLWRQRYTFQEGKGAVFGETDLGATTGYKMEASPNPDATWSDEFKNNIGIDAKFLNNRLSASVDGYYNHASNILIELTANIPVTVGGSVASQNYGVANYFGYELGLGWNDKIGKDLNYGVDLRFAWSDNKVVKGNFNDNDLLYPWKQRPGESADNGVWGHDVLGMFKNQQEIDAYVNQYGIKSVNPDNGGNGVLAANLKPGMLYYRDVRGALQPDGTFAGPDGIIDQNDQIQLAKKATNHYGFGTTLRASYKGIGVETVISGSFGGWSEIDGRKKMNNSIARTFASVPAYWGNIYDPVLNPGGDMPNPNWESISLSPISNFWRVSAFRMRMTSFQVNYSIPKKITEALKISNARVYFSALNPYNFYNPYSYRDSDAAYDIFPNLRTYSFGLNMTF